MTKRKTMLPKKSLCTTISSDHVRTIYETPQAVITVNSIFKHTAPYSDVFENTILRQHKAEGGLELPEEARYTKAQQNVAGTSLCDLRRSA